MSDYFQTIVPKRTYPDPVAKAAEILDWLIIQKIIKAKLTDCVLGSEGGFPPGEKCVSVVQEVWDTGWVKLITNGLEVITERFYFDGYSLSAPYVAECPHCQGNLYEGIDHEAIHEDRLEESLTEALKQRLGLVDKAISAWLEGEEGAISCPICVQTSLITHFRFETPIGLSNIGFKFWNWPELKEEFIKEFEARLGSKTTLVWGRL